MHPRSDFQRTCRSYPSNRNRARAGFQNHRHRFGLRGTRHAPGRASAHRLREPWLADPRSHAGETGRWHDAGRVRGPDQARPPLSAGCARLFRAGADLARRIRRSLGQGGSGALRPDLLERRPRDHGSVHAFTVRADGSPDDIPPKEDAVVKLVDLRFELAGTLRSGTRVIRVETPGPSMHEVDIFRLRGDHTVADVNRWRKREDSGLPSKTAGPVDALGGLLDSHDMKRVSWLRRDFPPGRYVLHCEMPLDPAATAGKVDVTHADAGMVREFVVAE